jgi:hypothetical protein
MIRAVATAALLAAVAAPAHASLIGTSTTASYRFLSAVWSDSFTVVNGVNISCPGAFDLCNALTISGQTLSYGPATIRYGYDGSGGNGTFNPGDPAEFLFSSLSPGFLIGGVSFATDLPGLDLSRVSFTADSVTVRMGGIALEAAGDFFELTLLPADDVPAPAAALLFGAGLVALGTVRRRTTAA